MGKKSKTKDRVGKHEAFKARFPDGTEVIMPPECPGWKSHEEALKALEKQGWKDARYAASFSSRELCDEITNQLKNKEIQVVDSTGAVPKGPDASHAVLSRIGFDLDRESSNNPNQAVILLRTKENTPAFLGGTTFGHIGSQGSLAAAQAVIHNSACPALMVFFDGQHMQMPTAVVQGTHKLCAKIVAAMIDRCEDSFQCAICMEPFLRCTPDGQVGMVPFLATDCDHAFHPQCIFKTLKGGVTTCPVCRGPLPIKWVPTERGERGERVERVERTEQRTSRVDVNALARAVREAAIDDEIGGVPLDPAPLSVSHGSA